MYMHIASTHKYEGGDMVALAYDCMGVWYWVDIRYASSYATGAASGWHDGTGLKLH